ncbi:MULTISPECIES: sensor histidine kinase [unclassified Phyllobacterium]|uniref:sensor histidine kinase n=1 Tax=Phyllobacterium TaxID=28100 RepID=UPI00088CB8D7|nr:MULTISPECIES: sensor histidine kinase [unclassified Phyllobacterium]MBA8902286.1 signal transduction histidine kinase [Phyllobacterium sp. P30BS-XVII]UGX87023.1 sensor histidine kinase [Phyllobacterium sp. T1293]SDN87337.1 Histidine kinase-, DNA gyrase B-, and HSP90-like ATPase [Phyllobacterium sp. OV277]
MKLDKYLDPLFYIILIGAALLCVWSFVRADLYRIQTNEIMSQTFEVQVRASQAREKIASIKGYLMLATRTGDPEPRLIQEVTLMNFNLKSLDQLDYADRFLDAPDIASLKKTILTVDTVLTPQIKASQFDKALKTVQTIETDIFRTAGSTLAHSITLQGTATIAADVARNKLLGAAGALILAGLLIHQRSLLARRKDQHIRSFSALFAHMTRTRIAALRLFLGYVGNNAIPSSEMTEAARSTIAELESINEGLMMIGHSKTQFKKVPLGDLLADIVSKSPINLQLDIEQAARKSLIPASQFHLIIDELVRNATNAVATRTDPVIAIRASVNRRFLQRPQLVLVVADNGIGMSPSTLAKAKEPFFSTKAGVHLGLGLTNCMELVKTMTGKLKITSVPDVGTTVRISYGLDS